jgi:Second Messenger Oligonucleotide or Dinucleotide Synthetase domain
MASFDSINPLVGILPAQPQGNALGALFAPSPFPPVQNALTQSIYAGQWIYVRRRFGQLLAELQITPSQHEDGEREHSGVRRRLNAAYWDVDSDAENSLLIGSWGKDTRVRPPRDIDVLFLLPPSYYHQFQQRTGNRQSALLQHVKQTLTAGGKRRNRRR